MTSGESPGAAAGHEDLEAGDALPRLLKVVGGIVAPTSLLTGLLFYFGRSRSSGYYRYFRVNSTVLDLTTNDYLFGGVDGLFVPVSVTCLLALVALWLHRLLLTRVPGGARERAVRVLGPVAGAAGVVLLTLAFLDLFGEGRLFGANSATGGVFLALGVVLLVYAVRLIRHSLPAPPEGDGAPPPPDWRSGVRPSCSSASGCSGLPRATRSAWGGAER
ncbi:hypothetical protein [Blastococcus brunescens]|uniref:Uncharacterized protein n=1 Tax=Blastococcus brunescens TaxID=1564165 RepID=A0ABZ1B4G0_9ACTN|nr:hypothetical protein [Blastococcus sp. BMG 8361]WRL63940.1 hypothetical protein U6N30_30785 [Blastococcus sp. BMG 8361]